VATRKALTLIDSGARVTVVAPGLSERLQRLADKGVITYHRREYRTDDLKNMYLVIGATNNRELNDKIFRDAERLGRLCNIADQPKSCNFVLPAVVNRGDLQIAISTSGKSPAFAKKLRKELEKQFGEEYAVFLRLMGAVRNKLLDGDHNSEAHRAVFELLIEKGLLETLRARNIEAVNSILREVLGEEYSYENLMDAGNKP